MGRCSSARTRLCLARGEHFLISDFREVYPFAAPFNFTGQPSISLPLGQSREGLPIGMMFSARYADEATLIRLAAQLEQACPWHDKRPKLGG